MATETYSGGGAWGRKFSISRKNGQIDKKGKPHFFEWIKELPGEDSRKGREFETRKNSAGAEHYYELFTALSGLLVGMERIKKTIQDKEQEWLVLKMQDGADDYTVEVGQIDSRYAQDIMKRILDPNFDPRQVFRISPYSIVDKSTGKENIGLAAMSGMDGKLTAKWDENSNLAGIPQAESREWKGKTEWDFSPVYNWLWEQVSVKVIPKLQGDPLAVRQGAALAGQNSTNVRPDHTAANQGFDSPVNFPTVDVSNPDNDPPF